MPVLSLEQVSSQHMLLMLTKGGLIRQTVGLRVLMHPIKLMIVMKAISTVIKSVRLVSKQTSNDRVRYMVNLQLINSVPAMTHDESCFVVETTTKQLSIRWELLMEMLESPQLLDYLLARKSELGFGEKLQQVVDSLFRGATLTLLTELVEAGDECSFDGVLVSNTWEEPGFFRVYTSLTLSEQSVQNLRKEVTVSFLKELPTGLPVDIIQLLLSEQLENLPKGKMRILLNKEVQGSREAAHVDAEDTEDAADEAAPQE